MGGNKLTAYNTKDSVEKHLKKCMKIALEVTAKQLTNKLMDFIDMDYYKTYDPVQYSRTDQFKDSPKFQMLSTAIVSIFVDTNSMHYKKVTGDYVAALAAQGFHGNEYIFRAGYYWEDFIEYCRKNVIDIYKQELAQQGLRIS